MCRDARSQITLNLKLKLVNKFALYRATTCAFFMTRKKNLLNCCQYETVVAKPILKFTQSHCLLDSLEKDVYLPISFYGASRDTFSSNRNQHLSCGCTNTITHTFGLHYN